MQLWQQAADQARRSAETVTGAFLLALTIVGSGSPNAAGSGAVATELTCVGGGNG